MPVGDDRWHVLCVTEFDIAYALGLLVGEGSFVSCPDPRISVKLNTIDPLPLNHLQYVFGGNIYGPYVYKRKGGGKDFDFRIWNVTGRSGIFPIIPLLDRMPESRKRNQYLEWKENHNFR